MATSQSPDIYCIDAVEVNEIMPRKPIKNLMQLNDYCLDEILCHLPVDDLNNVASTCRHLKTISRGVFGKLHKNEWLKLVVGTTEKRHELDSHEHLYIAQILNNFGDILSKLNVSFNYSGADDHPDLGTKILNLIIRRCTGSVVHLILNGCRHEAEDLIDPLPFFRNIKALEFHKGSITNGASLAECEDSNRQYLGCGIFNLLAFLPFFRNMKASENHKRGRTTNAYLAESKDLNRQYLDVGIFNFLDNNYPKLESFALTYDNADDPKSRQTKLNNFLRNHPNLKDIKFDCGKYCELAIIGEIKYLECLHLDESFDIEDQLDIMPLAQLKYLKKLRLFIGGNMKTEFLGACQSTNTLEVLDLWTLWDFHDDYNAFVSQLARFRKLQVLKFYGADQFRDEHFIHLHHLKDLRVLHIRMVRHITADGLVELVENLTNLKELVFCLFYNSWVNETKFILQSSTYHRLVDVCQGRGHKLVIKNYGQEKADDVVQFANDGFCNVVEYREYHKCGVGSINL